MLLLTGLLEPLFHKMEKINLFMCCYKTKSHHMHEIFLLSGLHSLVDKQQRAVNGAISGRVLLPGFMFEGPREKRDNSSWPGCLLFIHLLFPYACKFAIQI